jgi:hypothetical protein
MTSHRNAVAAVVCLLTLPCAARATVRVFVTPASAGYGLTKPENAFVPTYSYIYPNGVIVGGLDFTSGEFVCTSFPPLDAPSGTCLDPVVLAPGEFAYIWVQFQNEPAEMTINGLAVQISECGQTTPADVDVCYYVQDNSQGPPPVNHRRWANMCTGLYCPEMRQNPQTLIAISSGGIVNLASDPPPEENWNMHDVQAAWDGWATGVALLGAVKAPSGQSGKKYAIDITNISFTTPPNPMVAGGAFFAGDGPPICPGDLNCDGQVDFGDINPFVLYLSNYSAWLMLYPGCHPFNGDVNGDGIYGQGSFADINPFVALLSSGDPPYPCP